MQIVLINDAFEFGFSNLIRVETELGKAPLAACVGDHTCQGAKHAALVPRVVLLAIWWQKVRDFENVHGAFVRGASEILVLQVKREVAYRRGCAASAKLTEFLTCRWIKNSDQCSLSWCRCQKCSIMTHSQACYVVFMRLHPYSWLLLNSFRCLLRRLGWYLSSIVRLSLSLGLSQVIGSANVCFLTLWWRYLLKPGEVNTADLVLTSGHAEVGSWRDGVQAATNVAIRLNRGKSLHLAHFHAWQYTLLSDYESISNYNRVKHTIRLE